MVREVVIAHQDSQTRRKIYSQISEFEQIEIKELVSKPTQVFEAVEKNDPDLLLLGIKFDKISGLDILNHLMSSNPLPILMIGEETKQNKEEAVKAFSYGAVDFVSTSQKTEEIRKLIQMASESKMNKLVRNKQPKIDTPEISDKILVIGSSTGGPPEIERLLKTLDKEFPAPIVIAQHMGEKFTKLFAERLDDLSDLEVEEAGEKNVLKKGKVWIAPGDKDVEIKKSEDNPYIETRPPSEANTPSIDKLFKTASQVYGSNTVSIILSGMGEDGAIGASYIKSQNGTVITQDKETSKVYGMPKQVKQQGHSDTTLPLKEIPEEIARCI